jgi:acyl carrier protein
MDKIALTLKNLNFKTMVKEELSENLKLYLKLIMARYLHIEDVNEIQNDVSIFSLGITSLNAVEIQQEIETRMVIKIEAADFFNHVTIDKLVHYLVEKKLSQNAYLDRDDADKSFKDISSMNESFEQNAYKAYAKDFIKKTFGL